MAASVCLGWLRQAHLRPGLRQNAVASLVAAAALGLGMCGAIVLALSAEALPFPLGYRYRDVPMLLLGSVVLCFPAIWWLANSLRWWALVGSGAWLGAVMMGLQFGFVQAIGFRPGIRWHEGFTAMAAFLWVVGITTALALAFSENARMGRRRTMWRLGSAVLLGLVIVAGHEVLMGGANLLAQVGSVFRREVPAPLLCLVLGVVVPLVYVIMLFDLRMLRSHQRRTKRREFRDRMATMSQLSTFGPGVGESMFGPQGPGMMETPRPAPAAPASPAPASATSSAEPAPAAPASATGTAAPVGTPVPAGAAAIAPALAPLVAQAQALAAHPVPLSATTPAATPPAPSPAPSAAVASVAPVAPLASQPAPGPVPTAVPALQAGTAGLVAAAQAAAQPAAASGTTGETTMPAAGLVASGRTEPSLAASSAASTPLGSTPAPQP